MIRSVDDMGVTLRAVVLRKGKDRIKVRIDGGGVPSWIPKSQVICRKKKTLVVTEWFARMDGLV